MSIQPPPPGSYPAVPPPSGSFPAAPPPPGSYPTMAPAQWQAPAAQGPAPSTVVTSFRLMLVQTTLGLVNIVVALFTADAVKEQLRAASPGLDQSGVDTMASALMGMVVAAGIVGIVVWIWLAFKVRAGRNWARIVTFVFAGLGILSGLASFAQAGSALSHIIGFLALAIDIALIVLLTRGPSAEYFRRRV